MHPLGHRSGSKTTTLFSSRVGRADKLGRWLTDTATPSRLIERSACSAARAALESLLSINCTESENGRWDVPNAATIAAIEELERGGGKTFNSIEELMAELND